MPRLLASLLCGFLLAACSGSSPEPADGGQDAGAGVCCPRSENTCPTGGIAGGWAPTETACADIPMLGNDGEFILRTDVNGCDYWTAEGFCTGGVMCCTVDER